MDGGGHNGCQIRFVLSRFRQAVEESTHGHTRMYAYKYEAANRRTKRNVNADTHAKPNPHTNANTHVNTNTCVKSKRAHLGFDVFAARDVALGSLLVESAPTVLTLDQGWILRVCVCVCECACACVRVCVDHSAHSGSKMEFTWSRPG